MGHGRDLLFTLARKLAETSRKIWEDIFYSLIFFLGERLMRLFARRPFSFFFGEHLRFASLVLAEL